MKTKPRILVACIGNIFLGDDAFGCEVERCLAKRKLPDEVELKDFGIRSYDLAYALMDGYEITILVDAMPRGGAPGTVYVIEPDRKDIDAIDVADSSFEPHGMNPMKVLSMVKVLGGNFNKIVIVGCEPAYTGENDDGYMGLSEPVAAAVEKAADFVELVVARSLERQSSAAGA